MDIQQIQLFLGIAIIVIMLGMGMSLTISDFTRIVKQPKSIIAGLIAQMLILPVLAFSLIHLFDVNGPLAIGIMLISAAPGGAVSNMFTFLAKGDIALSVSLTAITSLVTIISIPFIIGFSLDQFMDLSSQDDVVNKADFFKTLILLLLVPISIGMTIKRFKPNIADKSEKPVKYASVILLATIIIVAVWTNQDKLLKALPSVGPLVISMNILTMALGFFIAKLLKLKENQQTTITIECGIQNGTLALGLATMGILGNYEEILLPPALYSVWMFFTGGAFSYLKFKNNQNHEKNSLASADTNDSSL